MSTIIEKREKIIRETEKKETQKESYLQFIFKRQNIKQTIQFDLF